MSLDDDPWIYDNVGDPKKLHALGTVTVMWNMCERQLHGLFESVSQLPTDLSWTITHDMRDVTLCEKIKQYASKSGLSDHALGLVSNAIAVYDRCRINRNQLTHFHVADFGINRLGIERLKGADATRVAIDDSVDNIRRVSDDIVKLFNYIIFLRSRIDRHYTLGEEIKWNKKLPLPASLVPLTPELPKRSKSQKDHAEKSA